MYAAGKQCTRYSVRQPRKVVRVCWMTHQVWDREISESHCQMIGYLV